MVDDQSPRRSFLSDPRLFAPVGSLRASGLSAREHVGEQPDLARATKQHRAALDCVNRMGLPTVLAGEMPGCPDSVFTSNWAITWRGRALMGRLPAHRSREARYARPMLEDLGFQTRTTTHLFSGQGDALIIGGSRMLLGHGFRTDASVGAEIRSWLGLAPILLQAIPLKDAHGVSVRNPVTGLPDSLYYDLDLAVAVITPELLAVCWEALTPPSRDTLRAIGDVEIIAVDPAEALDGMACNLVSDGTTVVMSPGAPALAESLTSRGLRVMPVPVTELAKSGGGLACIALALHGA